MSSFEFLSAPEVANNRLAEGEDVVKEVGANPSVTLVVASKTNPTQRVITVDLEFCCCCVIFGLPGSCVFLASPPFTDVGAVGCR